MSTWWAIMNDCNGPFELFAHRAEAVAALDQVYLDAGCYVAACEVTKMDENDAYYEHIYENQRERWGLYSARHDIVTAIRARGGR